MGREVKRVALNFEWPIDKNWAGYMNPWYAFRQNCSACDGSGYSPQANRMRDEFYGYVAFDPVAYGSTLHTMETPGLRESVTRKIDGDIQRDGKGSYYLFGGRFSREQAIEHEMRRMLGIYNQGWHYHLIQADVDALAANGDLQDLTHRWSRENGWTPIDPPPVLTPTLVNRFAMFSFAGGSGWNYTAIKARCEREGVPVECSKCHGKGDRWQPADAKQKADEWERIEPPAGEGWQVWQTVSEGAPISPVFATPEELAEYMANAKPWGGASKMPAAKWLQWITSCGYAPSMVMDGGVVMDGVEAMVQ